VNVTANVRWRKLRVDERLDLREEWVVTLHQVRDEETPRLSRERDDLVGLLHRDRQRLLDDDVLAPAESGSRLLVVQKWRRGDIDEIHRRHREQHFRTLYVRKTETLGADERRFAIRARDVPQRGPRHLRELVRSEHGEAAEAEDTDADRVR
jgi:hypothetical protein